MCYQDFTSVTPFDEGYRAYKNGKDKVENPYDYYTEFVAWVSWSNGWYQAKEDN